MKVGHDPKLWFWEVKKSSTLNVPLTSLVAAKGTQAGPIDAATKNLEVGR